MPMMRARGGGFGGRVAFAAAGAAPGPAPEMMQFKKATRVRKLFPETWMWRSQYSPYVCWSMLLFVLS
jgi:hypothetical protein